MTQFRTGRSRPPYIPAGVRHSLRADRPVLAASYYFHPSFCAVGRGTRPLSSPAPPHGPIFGRSVAAPALVSRPPGAAVAQIARIPGGSAVFFFFLLYVSLRVVFWPLGTYTHRSGNRAVFNLGGIGAFLLLGNSSCTSRRCRSVFLNYRWFVAILHIRFSFLAVPAEVMSHAFLLLL